MSSANMTITATFEDGVLRPDQPLPLAPRQQVTLVVQLPDPGSGWPDNVAEIYRDIATEDRRLAETMFSAVQETWPIAEDRPSPRSPVRIRNAAKCIGSTSRQRPVGR
jgi:predicted DNA-binding antitoxin AbrB/MazE fold protein